MSSPILIPNVQTSIPNVQTSIPNVQPLGANTGSTTSTITASTGFPFGPSLLLIVFFVILVIALAVWNFLLRDQLTTRNLSQTQSTQCLSTQCINGTKKINVQLDPSQNPNTAEYETYNFCSINAPPTSFVQSLELCAGFPSSEINVGDNSISPPNDQQITDFAKFYNQEYVDTCGWSWKNPSPEIAGQSTPQSDPVINSLVKCAEVKGINDPNIQSLKSKCTNCDFSNFVSLT